MSLPATLTVPRGLAFRASDDALFCTDNTGDELWQLDPVTGAAISGYPVDLPSGLARPLGLAFRG